MRMCGCLCLCAHMWVLMCTHVSVCVFLCARVGVCVLVCVGMMHLRKFVCNYCQCLVMVYFVCGTCIIGKVSSNPQVLLYGLSYTLLGKTIAGTTDSPIAVTHLPAPDESDIKFILSEVKRYLSPDISVRRGDVQAAWSGLRPLVRDPNKSDTQSIARNHIIEVSKGELVTIAGGEDEKLSALLIM